MSVSVITFDSKYRGEFARLNYAWINKHFAVEPLDRQILEHPESELLEHGGEVFFALEQDRVVGTVALKSIDSRRCELTKMAVEETERGKGYGKLLLDAAIDHARKKGLKQIELSSHTSLEPAIKMYRTAGFVERRDNADSCYTRCNIYMEKVL